MLKPLLFVTPCAMTQADGNQNLIFLHDVKEQTDTKPSELPLPTQGREEQSLTVLAAGVKHPPACEVLLPAAHPAPAG